MTHRKNGWTKIYVLRIIYSESKDERLKELIENNKVINETAEIYEKKNKEIVIPITLKIKMDMFGDFYPDSKSDLYQKPPMVNATLDDKLMVIAHGKPDKISKLTPHSFSFVLKEAKLKNIGVIAFKSCLIGKENFLINFKKEMEKFAQIGYYVGYTSNVKFYPRDSCCGNGKYSMHSGKADILLSAFFGYKAPDKYRVKVIEGNAAKEVDYVREVTEIK